MRIRIKRKINEDWRDTSWRFQDKKVTIGDIIDYIGDKIIEINPPEMRDQILKNRGKDSLPTRGQDRIDRANLNYPIIVVMKDGQYQYVLDGNHRLQKAVDLKKPLKAKVLNLDEPDTPQIFIDLFG